MSSLTAIDILILPDDTMVNLAKEWNGRLLESIPTGFALDADHTPHITLLQRYVHTDHLDDVFRSVDSAINAVSTDSLSLSVVKLAHLEVQGIGLAGLVVKPGPEVINLQSALIDAIRPYTGAGGSAEAYVRTEAEPDINEETIRYVESYVPEHSGENFLAHVTVGQAKLDDLARFEAEGLEPLTFHPAGFAVYQLGNNGTAQKELHIWKPE